VRYAAPGRSKHTTSIRSATAVTCLGRACRYVASITDLPMVLLRSRVVGEMLWRAWNAANRTGNRMVRWGASAGPGPEFKPGGIGEKIGIAWVSIILGVILIALLVALWKTSVGPFIIVGVALVIALPVAVSNWHRVFGKHAQGEPRRTRNEVRQRKQQIASLRQRRSQEVGLETTDQADQHDHKWNRKITAQGQILEVCAVCGKVGSVKTPTKLM
jgi:hypothetical protein